VLSTHGSLLGHQKHHPPAPRNFLHRLYDGMTLKSAVKRADAVVVSSLMEYEEALEFGIGKHKLHIIPDGIDSHTVDSDRSGRLRKDLCLLFAGPVTRSRRVELLLRAARKLTLPFRIIIADTPDRLEAEEDTSGYIRELRKLAKTLGMEDRIDILENPSPQELSQCYADADIFIYPSAYETSGTTLLQAGTSGLPIISTPVGLAKEIVVTGENGFIVPADPDMICDRILQLGNEDTRQKFGQHMREKVLGDFGWNAVMKRYMDLYDSLKKPYTK
jgi:glycosyltransferase involved in cell wall biosynthesis